MKPTSQKHVAVIGTGPAGLMAAYTLAKGGYLVTLFEKKSGPGRKLLIAGSSGLNITYECPADQFHQNYCGPESLFKDIFEAFPPDAWLKFINDLGINTFKGTSRRYFVEGMKASILLKKWTEALVEMGTKILFEHECDDFELLTSAQKANGAIRLHFKNGESSDFDAAVFALGGGSWEPKGVPLLWPGVFERKGLHFEAFRSSNVGFEVDWPAGLLKEAEGQPIKNLVLTSPKGQRQGELVITNYGLEGTPIYFAGIAGDIFLDLKPDLTDDQILARLSSSKENLSPIRRVKKYLSLSPGAFALIFHLTPKNELMDLSALVRRIKRFQINLKTPRPLEEAISSSGGLDFAEISEALMFKRYPGVFVAGEMLNWDAPTGGFLIQASVSQGYWAAQGILKFLG